MEAMALLCRSLSQLEVGELSVLSFGGRDGVKEVLTFDQPFSDEAGVKVRHAPL
jgi:midasin